MLDVEENNFFPNNFKYGTYQVHVIFNEYKKRIFLGNVGWFSDRILLLSYYWHVQYKKDRVIHICLEASLLRYQFSFLWSYISQIQPFFFFLQFIANSKNLLNKRVSFSFFTSKFLYVGSSWSLRKWLCISTYSSFLISELYYIMHAGSKWLLI